MCELLKKWISKFVFTGVHEDSVEGSVRVHEVCEKIASYLSLLWGGKINALLGK